MAERKKPSSKTHDQVPEHRTKRARLTRSTSRFLTEPADSSDSSRPKNGQQAQSLAQSEDSLVPSLNEVQNLNGGEGAPTSTPTPSSRLPELLDLSGVTTHEIIAFRFGQIARSLMHEHILVVSQDKISRTEYELLEVEFYLRKEGHEDPFTHAAPEQTESGKWYFHRAPQRSGDPTRSATSLSGYRGGTRKGMDLTFGGPVSSSYFARDANAETDRTGSSPRPRGGILFRSMRRLSDGAVISGPSLLVDELLRVCGCTSIAELVGEALAKDRSAFPSAATKAPKKCSISLKPRTSALTKKPTVYSSPRIGLDLSHPGTTTSPSDPRIVFIQKPYRFFMSPVLLTANGRPQTFLGIYNLISEAEILNESGVLDEVSRLTGIKRVSVEKYAADFQQGKECGKIETFIGSAGKGASSSPSTYLKMMGTLAQLSTS
ncbi:hypothetical protein A7U60_g5697 [Sanghuangporus baumii]|uniref:Uncharacterized protein n=1 Tax=Sanghuangporus baumii TaxID=108892 RepID=A0A9Q5N7S0_SANBA|nr:hypothetical protein A7U60_g5697 [Sanghuangporus baumii]